MRSLMQVLAGEPRGRAGEPRGTGTITSLAQLFGTSAAGFTVTPDSAMRLSAVWAAVWLIADQGSSLPVRVMEQTTGDVEVPAPNTPQQRLMDDPNPESSPVDVWSVVLVDLDLWGNAYLGKEKAAGTVGALWPIRPWKVRVERIKGRKRFIVTEDDGTVKAYGPEDIVHIKGRSLDGFVGVSTIEWQRNTVGMATALDEFGGSTMRNRAVPLGILKVKGRITDPLVAPQLRKEWKDRLTGRGQNDIAVLDEDADFKAVQMPLLDVQYIEQRGLSLQDIGRMFGGRVLIEALGGAVGNSMTYANIESRNRDLLQMVLRPRLARIEGALFSDPDLYSNFSRRKPRFSYADFLRADTKGQFEALRVATGNRPIITQDEARLEIGKKPLGGAAAELSSAASNLNTPGRDAPPADPTET